LDGTKYGEKQKKRQKKEKGDNLKIEVILGCPEVL
jgi:hypothetical protein